MLETNNWIVLIVDDHLDNIMVAQTTLEFYGAEVLVAENGRAALESLKDTTPTVILLDLSMPIMSGWELLEHLKAHNPDIIAEVPIIAVTAHAMEGDRQKALDSGFDGYLPKPYEIHQLVPYMKQTLMNKKGIRS